MNTRDRGLTLVELMLASSLAAVLVVSIGSALVSGLRLTGNTFTRLDQSNAELIITRLLAPDVYAAEGEIVLNGATAAACGDIVDPKLQLRSRTDPGEELVADNITTVVWSLVGTDVVRTVCVDDLTVDESVVVVDGIGSFAPASCSSPCPVVTVEFTAAEGPGVPARDFSITVQRRGATS